MIESILEIYIFFYPKKSWIKERYGITLKSSRNILFSDEGTIQMIHSELRYIYDLLEPAKIKKYFNIEKKGFFFLCPICYSKEDSKYEEMFKTAQLVNGKKEPYLFCPVCDKNILVKRDSCEKCNKNIFDFIENCLFCSGLDIKNINIPK